VGCQIGHPTTAKAQSKASFLRRKTHEIFVTAAKTDHTNKTVGQDGAQEGELLPRKGWENLLYGFKL